MTLPPYEPIAYARNPACEHGYRRDAAYWHAWQEGRAFGWSEGSNRPLWWLRLTFRLGELRYRLTHRRTA